jgi:hypothetical protein
MLKDKLNKIVSMVEPFMLEKDFSKKKDGSFIRKNKSDYGREELFSFNARAHREDPNSIYVSCMIGIYYPGVRKMEKNFINDFILKYPIVAGSISHFSPKKIFLSVLYTPGKNEDEVYLEIKNEMEQGGFNLAKTFPDLEHIYAGILNRHPFLSEYHKVYDERRLLTVTCIILLLKGKEKAIEWVKDNYKESTNKTAMIEKIEKLD